MRFSILDNGISNTKNQSNFISSHTKFAELILQLYRSISQNIQGFTNNIYRQTQAGVKAGIVLNRINNNIPQSTM